ncbi:MAG: S46 family peptidase [Marinilabiliaceae bacterium]|nr:S46 family peptidase [Marinilabiliaceae bacterium]
MKRLVLLLLACAVVIAHTKADEGMWVPLFINKNIADMQAKGCKLTAEDIYSVNKASLKDAVVIFDEGCTAEFVSDRGLLLTNYHCGYDAIQQLSSETNDYLSDGYWSKSESEDLPCIGLTIRQLLKIEDVTSQILKETSKDMKAELLTATIQENIEKLTEQMEESIGQSCQVDIESFLAGEQYLAYVYREFKDVRLVGAPPSSLGKFGGDTDNWVWPRHTCDFSVFRVYVAPDGTPAEYSTVNVPYKPVRHLEISTRGVREGDFVMVMGYPGSTNIYAPSSYVEMQRSFVLPACVELRTAKLRVMNKHQAKSQKVEIQYASKNASTSNAWKKWQGEIRGITRSHAVEKKREVERALKETGISEVIARIDSMYNDRSETSYANMLRGRSMLAEVFRGGVEMMSVSRYIKSLGNNPTDDEIEEVKEKLRLFYKDYDKGVATEMATEVLKVVRKYIPASLLPEWMKSDKSIRTAVADMARSRLMSEKWVMLRLDKRELAFLKREKSYQYFETIYDLYRTGIKNFARFKMSTSELYANETRLAQAIMNKSREAGQERMSDANFTQRVSYGQVMGYEGSDAVVYRSYTTLDGLIGKFDAGAPDYKMPEGLRKMNEKSDFGVYADKEDGRLHTCFISTCHTTGGNSGSPVLDAEGRLIGLNFDRDWDGVMSDYYYDASLARNIVLDVRYLLFIVDKFAGAQNLAKEIIGE